MNRKLNLNALDQLLLEKKTGQRRAANEKLMDDQEQDQESSDDLDDFIENDIEDDFMIPQKQQDNRRVKQKKMPVYKAKENDIYKFMGDSKPKTSKLQDKVVKADLDLQSKELMEKLLSESFEENGMQLSQIFEQKPSNLFKSKIEQQKDLFDIPLFKTGNEQDKIQEIQKQQNVKMEEEINGDYKDSMMEDDYQQRLDQILLQKKIEEEQMAFSKINETPEKRMSLSQNQQIQNQWNEIQQNQMISQSPVVQNEFFSQNKNYDAIRLDNDEIHMFWIDAFEDQQNHPGSVFLVGKALNKITKIYETMCVQIKNMDRNLFVIPNEQNSHDEDLIQVQLEVNNMLSQRMPKLKNVPLDWRSKCVIRNYAFELPIQKGKQKVLKLKYSFQLPALKPNEKGKTFDYILGTSYSALELFILKRKLKGPQWLVIRNGRVPKQFDSWCQYEYEVAKMSYVRVLDDQFQKDHPPPLFKIVSIGMKTYKNQKNNQNEIVALSLLTDNDFEIEKTQIIDNKKFQQTNLLRKLDNCQFPQDFEQNKNKNQNITVFQNETAMINFFMGKLNKMDPDIIVCHDLYSGFLDLLLSRINKLNISNVSKLGRIKKQGGIQKNMVGGSLYKSRYFTCGRLLCDTYLSARELIKENDFSLNYLAKQYLKKDQTEFNVENTIQSFESSTILSEYLNHTAFDAYLTLELLFKFEILPLTRQLTNIAGNLWIKSLQNARAERNEMLLMHEFHKEKFIWPDKYQNQKFNEDQVNYETIQPQTKSRKSKKKYAGGLVLQPKSGLYDKIVLLLDFNSLYPSIIQEYSICFTTVIRNSMSLDQLMGANKKSSDDQDVESDTEDTPLPILEDEQMQGILPKVIKGLVQKRKHVKNLLKNAKDEMEKKNLDIKQLAIKLIANSMYGCLGFKQSRFYAKPLAALITRTGREILQKTCQITQDNLKLNIIYGDTDSIMVYSNTDKLGEAIKTGQQIKKLINTQYKCLEIEIDGVYKPLLLLKKKKYAALKLDNLGELMNNPTSQPIYKKEIKGLDMVRRDWSDISKQTSSFALEQILSGKEIDEVVSEIRQHLKQLNDDLNLKKISLRSFIITKQLTKQVHEYQDAKSLPHVQVAKRMGDSSRVGHFIHYIVCKDPKVEIQSKSIADRSYHPKEYREKQGEIEIDIDYYKSEQIMPPLIRICENLEQTCIQNFALQLQLDSSKYRNYGKTNDEIAEEELNSQENQEREMEEIHDDISLKLYCRICKDEPEFKGLFYGSSEICHLICKKCKKPYDQKVLLNRLQLKVNEIINNYYKQEMLCEEQLCKKKSRQMRLKPQRCSNLDCIGKVISCQNETRISRNLTYIENLFKNKTGKKIDPEIENTCSKCQTMIKKVLEDSKVKLKQIFGPLTSQSIKICI